MFRSFWQDRKLVFLVVILGALMVLMLQVWWHYDTELEEIDKKLNQLKVRGAMENLNGR
jgi:hypothetical protein